MDHNFQNKLSGLLERSDFVRSIKLLKSNRAKSRLFADSVRDLSGYEIELLVSQGNVSPDWSKIRVALEFRTDFIRGNTFNGECILGVFSGIEREIAQGVMIPDGIYNSTIVCCEIGNECAIHSCGLIANYCIKEKVVIFHCGSISAGTNCRFGNGIAIPVGMETGGREVSAFAEIDVAIAEQVARGNDVDFRKLYDDFIRAYGDGLCCDYGIIESSSVIRNSNEIRNAYIGESACIEGAAFIENCTILSSLTEPATISQSAIVKNSCIQWGCEITSMAIVTDSVLTEHSHVERHGKVTASIIGPNTGIAEGEVTSCLVGPFVGFHHQALLIAAIWPQGKGNIAYGANVGSNHTSRAPDQEIFCGEGVFFGLGVNIKFPSDFSRAPYSIFATAVNTLPQKIEFPFSLIQSASLHSSRVPSLFNEIIPGWVLSENIYTILRNEGKYKKRNKAKRTHFELTVFRPDIIDQMQKARNRLRDIKRKKDVYIEKDIPGLGKNYLQEANRQRAVEAYSFFIEYYCLISLKNRLADIIITETKNDINLVYMKKTDSVLWEHAKELLKNEGYNKRSPAKNCKRLISILETIDKQAFNAKAKDDMRGKKIIPDYEKVYTLASDDSFIVNSKKETQESIESIKALISKLE